MGDWGKIFIGGVASSGGVDSFPVGVFFGWESLDWVLAELSDVSMGLGVGPLFFNLDVVLSVLLVVGGELLSLSLVSMVARLDGSFKGGLYCWGSGWYGAPT